MEKASFEQKGMTGETTKKKKAEIGLGYREKQIGRLLRGCQGGVGQGGA